MASLITVRLDKGNSPNLGFRLQGGKDFGTPLVIQKVNGGSPAERSGLIAGDSVIKINNTDVFNLRHKDAQDVIVRAGPSFEITVQRGGSTWKPSVTPIGSSFPSPTLSSSRNISPVTKTSLAANKKENIGAIGTGHNLSAKPFSSQVNGVNGCGRLVNNQYNSPLKLYSEQSIAETLSAQAEVLPTGALGVNFKKNEKNYDATNSAVYRMLQEAENETTSPETVIRSDICTTTNNHAINSHQAVTTSRSYTCLDEQNRSTDYPIDPNSSPLNQEGATICTDCERVIVGVFVRIKDKNLHIECFKCATCGTSLKNVGYYNINNKLYCDVHAKLAARNNPPAPNLVPITVPPGGKIPANSISAALASHSLPSPSPTSPKFAAPYQTNNNLSGPKPFSSVHAPLSPTYNTLPKTSPTTYSPASSAERSVNIIWPPSQEEPELPTACPLYFPPPSKVEKTIRNKKSEDINSLQEEDEEEEELQQINYMQEDSPNMSYSYEEFYNISGRKSSTECIENISETLETQKLVENVLYTRPHLKSVYQDAQIQDTKEETHSSLSLESCEMKRPTDFTPNTKETFSKTKQTSTIENSVPHKWESQMLQALKLGDDKKTDVFSQIPTKFSATPLATALSTAPSQPFSSKNISSKSIPLPEETVPYFPPEHPIIIKDDDLQNKNNKSEFKRPYQKKKNDPTSEFLKDLPKPTCKLTMRDALTIASDQPYSPIQFESIKVEENLEETNKRESKMVQYKDLQKPLKPKILPESFTKFSKQEPKECTYSINKVLETIRTEEKQSEEKSDIKETTTIEKQTCQKSTTPSFQIITEEQTNTGMYPLFKGFSCSFGNKTDHSEFKIEISTTPPILNEVNQPSVKITQLDSEENEIISKETTTIEKQELKKKSEEMKSKCVEKQAEEIIYKKPLPLTSTLHKAESLPQYQVNISENAEADLKLIQKVEMAQKVHEQQKMTNTKTKEKIVESIKKPNTQLCDRPPSTTFSPRPRSITPSMINKPPPAIPYYQASLVLQPCNPVSANLLDPTSPNVSRSPSPAPSIERRHSPFPASGVSSIRPKSPAVGPPPNPLRAPNGIPTPRDFKVDEAKRSLTNYLPQYKNKRDLIEREGNLEVAEYQDSLISKNISSSENLCNFQQESTCMEINKKECEQIRGSQIICEKLGKQDILTINSQKAHEEQLKQSELKSVEFQEGGRVEIQKKKTVTEEFDHIHKSKVIQIEKNVSSKQAHSFSNVKNPQIEKNQGVVGMHVTNPQPIQSCFLKSENSQCQSACNLKSKTCAKLQQQIKADQQLKCNSYPETGTSSMTDSQPFYQSQKSIPVRHVSAPGSSQKPNVNKSNIPVPNSGSTGGRQTGAVGVAPKRGRGVLNAASVGGTRIPLCGQCHSQIRGPFITALGKIWCPEHFICATPSCRRPLQDLGFVEEQGQLYCEYCFEQYLAPSCSKCGAKIKGDCLKAIGKNFHPECFNCVYCGKLFGNNAFFLEDGNPYCENDWNELFTTKCFACGFPVEAGDRWVEALNNNYHSQCFNCTMCKKNLEGQSFFAKGGRPYCKNHAR